MMDRRQFLRYVALTSLAASMPSQIDALERYYIANAPPSPGPLIAIDEISISGLATRSMPVTVSVMVKERTELFLGLNIFGGIFRWCAMPDGKILTKPDEFVLRLVSLDPQAAEFMAGHVRYVDQNAVRHSDPLDKWLLSPLEKWLPAES